MTQKSASFARIRNSLQGTPRFIRNSWLLLAGNEDRLGRLRNTCLALLILLLFPASVHFTWALFTPPPHIPAGPAATASTDQAPRMTDAEAAALGEKLTALHLFGKADPKTNIRETPETTLALILNGLMFSTSRARSLAIISENGQPGQEGVYGVGDALPGNATIEAIFADRVILRRSGHRETLSLKDHPEPKNPILPE